jgi:hypothetical protein
MLGAAILVAGLGYTRICAGKWFGVAMLAGFAIYLLTFIEG